MRLHGLYAIRCLKNCQTEVCVCIRNFFRHILKNVFTEVAKTTKELIYVQPDR